MGRGTALDGPDPAQVVDAFRLPGSAVAMTPVAGAWSHRVYRLQTDAGAYAVKELRDPWGDPQWQAWLAAAWDFELAAFRAGVPMPEPVVNPVDGGCLAWVGRAHGAGAAGASELVPVRVHTWVDGSPCPDGPVDADVAGWAGRLLARLHGLAVRPADRSVFPTTTTATADRWAELTAAARESQAPWADLVAGAHPAVRVAAELFAAADEGVPGVMSHSDVDQKNVVLAERGPVLCDWDVAAPVVPRSELADVALSFAGWERFEVAGEVVRAYRAAGGADDPIRPADLGRTLVVSLDWVAFNVERALHLRPATAAESTQAERLVPRLLADLPRQVDVALRVESLLP